MGGDFDPSFKFEAGSLDPSITWETTEFVKNSVAPSWKGGSTIDNNIAKRKQKNQEEVDDESSGSDEEVDDEDPYGLGSLKQEDGVDETVSEGESENDGNQITEDLSNEKSQQQHDTNKLKQKSSQKRKYDKEDDDIEENDQTEKNNDDNDSDAEIVHWDDENPDLTNNQMDEGISNNKEEPPQKKQKISSEFYARTPEGVKFECTDFGSLNLGRPLLKAISSLGYQKPTPIQAAVIPLALNGRDIVGSAVTGSGKTAAFALPLLERLQYRPKRVTAVYVLILVPTRELAVQVHSMVQKLGQHTDVRVALVVGGLSMSVQAAMLRANPEIVVATPGRIIDHVRNTQSVYLDDLQALVLDEADRLLSLGFTDEIMEIIRLTPKKRQTMLFSATMSVAVEKLVKVSLDRPVRLMANATAQVPALLTQEVIRLKGKKMNFKEAILLCICERSFCKGGVLIFCQTKAGAHRIKILFGLGGLPAAGELHGDMSQAARLQSLEDFRQNKVSYLIATDVAARGLDIVGVQVVINYDAPTQLNTYLHRIGRTARAGRPGLSVCFVTDENRSLLKEVTKKTKRKFLMRTVPDKIVEEWNNKIENMQEDIEKIELEEKEERLSRIADAKLQKAQNLIDHHQDIMSRPQRTWFMSEKEKQQIKKAAKEEAQGGATKETKQEKQLKKHQMKLEQEKQQKQKKLKQELDSNKGAIRAMKRKERELKQEGLSSGRAAKEALLVIDANKKDKQEKLKEKKKKKQQKQSQGDGLFQGDGLVRGAKVYAGGARSGKVVKPALGISQSQINKIKRGGRGKSAFKSKGRYKRKK